MRWLIEIPIILSVLIAAILFGFAWHRRSMPGSFSFSLLMLVLIFWSFCIGVALVIQGSQPAILWYKLGFSISVFLPALILLLIIQYSHHRLGSVRIIPSMMIIEPVIIIVLLWTNQFHHLFWKDYQSIVNFPVNSLHFNFGSVFYLHWIYSITLTIYGVIILLGTKSKYIGSPHSQLIIILVGIFLPWLGNIFWLLYLNTTIGIDWTPILFAFTSPLLAWGFFHYRLIDIIPVSYEDILENMKDSVIVTDTQDQVIALNTATQKFSGKSVKESLGLFIEDLLPFWKDLLLKPNEKSEQHLVVTMEGGSKQHIDVLTTPLHNKQGNHNGRIIVIRDITKSKLIEEDLHRQADEITTLHTTLLEITATHDLPVLLQTIVERATKLLHAYGGSLYLCDAEMQEVNCVVNYRNPTTNTGRILRYGEGDAGQIAEKGVPLIIDNYRAWPGRVGLFEMQPEVFALVGVPMIWRGEIRGVIIVVDVVDNRRFTNDNLKILQMLAEQAIIAVQNTNLYEAARRRAHEAETLHLAGSIVAATLNTDEAIERIMYQLAEVVPHDSASVMLMREGYLEIVGGHGWEDPKSVLGMKFPIPGDNPNTIVVLQRRPYILDDAPALYTEFSKYPHNHIISWLGVPLVVHDKVIGMLTVESIKKKFFTSDQSRLVTAFGDQVAIAIENARLYQSTRQAVDRLAILHHASQEVVTASFDPERVYVAIHEAASKLMPSEAFVITLLDESSNTIHTAYLFDHGGRAENFSFPRNRGISGQVVETGQALYIEDLLEVINTIDSIHYGDKEEVRSILAVPMRMGNNIIGTLSTQSYHPQAYTPEDQQLLEMLASYAAIALENARLFGEVHKLAITDGLTKAYNRRHLFELGQREVNRAIRFKRPLSVLLFDIDHFKTVNDRYGHSTGDVVLTILTQRVLSMVREIDIFGRYGGEEFALIMPETSKQMAYTVAERLRTEATKKPILTEQGEVTITISIGIADLLADTKDFTLLISKADSAMYLAKKAGRDRIELGE